MATSGTGQQHRRSGQRQRHVLSEKALAVVSKQFLAEMKCIRCCCSLMRSIFATSRSAHQGFP
jgi:hypothetical protein